MNNINIQGLKLNSFKPSSAVIFGADEVKRYLVFPLGIPQFNRLKTVFFVIRLGNNNIQESTVLNALLKESPFNGFTISGSVGSAIVPRNLTVDLSEYAALNKSAITGEVDEELYNSKVQEFKDSGLLEDSSVVFVQDIRPSVIPFTGIESFANLDKTELEKLDLSVLSSAVCEVSGIHEVQELVTQNGINYVQCKAYINSFGNKSKVQVRLYDYSANSVRISAFKRNLSKSLVLSGSVQFLNPSFVQPSEFQAHSFGASFASILTISVSEYRILQESEVGAVQASVQESINMCLYDVY